MVTFSPDRIACQDYSRPRSAAGLRSDPSQATSLLDFHR
jgi:hypothetical protein